MKDGADLLPNDGAKLFDLVFFEIMDSLIESVTNDLDVVLQAQRVITEIVGVVVFEICLGHVTFRRLVLGKSDRSSEAA
jgi:hypothetical protein